MSFEPDVIIKEIDSQYSKLSMADMEAYLIHTINEAAEKHGVNNTGFASLLNELGGFYRTTSRYQKSEEFFLKAKEILERTVGENNPNYATTINNLAGVYRLTGDFIKAERMFLKALEIYRRISYGESFVYSSALNNLGLIYMDTKEFEKALLLFEEANKIAKREKNSPVIYATGLGNSANAYLALGQVEKAKKMLIEAATIYKKFNKEDNNHYASALNSLGTFYMITNNLIKAEPLFLKVLSLREKDFGRNHHEFGKTAYNLCELYERKEAYASAEKYARLSVESYKNVLGENHITTQNSLKVLDRIKRMLLLGDASEKSFDMNRKEKTYHSLGDISGMELSLLSFVQFSATVLCKKFPEYSNRIAAGLVGEGSECYEFDDEISKDHDWGPSFCLWLNKPDFEKIGEALQLEYENHIKNFNKAEINVSTKNILPRRGVFEIGDFYQKHIGAVVPPNSIEEWCSIPESKLSVATNGKVFLDPLNDFSRFRNALTRFYPEDLRLRKLATECAIMAQSGQYNYPRSLKRFEYVAAQHGLSTFIDATISLVFLLNRKYKPYYKWMHKAMKALPILGEELYEKLQYLATENPQAISSPSKMKIEVIEEICLLVAKELRNHGLSSSEAAFLLEHAKQIPLRITDDVLRNLPINMEE